MAQLELKNYQENVLADLEEFVRIVVETGNIANAYREYWRLRGITLGQNSAQLRPYQNTVPGVPRVTAKVPTAGGKTFIAVNAIDTIFRNLPPRDAKVVAWFVPSDTILTQTLANLRNPMHPYRQRLNTLFSNRVAVVDKESALMGANISPNEVKEQLTIFVLSAASFVEARNSNPRVYRDNGNLESYSGQIAASENRLLNAEPTSLIQVIRHLNPVVIVDESHNFTSDLRDDMLEKVNPCFIYELTATPRQQSNIITFVGAELLKKANMVKLPVIVHNDQSKEAVIGNAITLRNNLERQAVAAREKGGDYVRPVVLFQAQPRTEEDSETFDKIKQRLVEQFSIPEEQIAIKTANINQIKDINLMAEDCPIRYIITVNALKEGWDCPFAYILASLANRSSKIDVEQILGRILRQPYARKQKSTFLNMSYTFTNSADFAETLDSIIEGLNRSGFSAKDYRATSSVQQPQQNIVAVNPDELASCDDLFSMDAPVGSLLDAESDGTGTTTVVDMTVSEEEPASPETIKTILQNSESEVESILENAQAQAENYEEMLDEQTDEPTQNLPTDSRTQESIYHIAPTFRGLVEPIKIPQFFINTVPSLIDGQDGYDEFLEKENLLEGFDLMQQDKVIDFDTVQSSTRMIDIDENHDYNLMSMSLQAQALNAFRQFYMSIDNDSKIRVLTAKIVAAINIPGVFDRQLISYVTDVLKTKNSDELISLGANLGSTIEAFKIKINQLIEKYRENQFKTLIEIEKIFVKPQYSFPASILLPETTRPLEKSLYLKEGKINGFEYGVIERVAALPNIKFWHRNIERQGFCINGFINHYPDFIIMTESGRIVLLETKGNDRRNPDSMSKIQLGSAWSSACGLNYRYFMVFESEPLEGAYTINRFLEILKLL